MKAIAALTVALLTLLAPAAATARMTTDEQRLAVFTPVARQMWPQIPAADFARIHVNLHADAELAADRAAITATSGSDPGPLQGCAHLTDGTWAIDIASGMTDAEFGDQIVHEYGHFAGFSHDNTRPNVMNGHGEYGTVPQVDAAIDATLTDHERINDLLVNQRVVAIKATRRGSSERRRGIRYIVVTAGHRRWYISGYGLHMHASRLR